MLGFLKKTERKESTNAINYFTLFRYATPLDIVAFVGAIIMSFLTAMTQLLTVVLYGEIVTLLVDRTVTLTRMSTKTYVMPILGGGERILNATVEENKMALLNDLTAYGIGVVIQLILYCVTSYLTIHWLNWSANRQILRIRTVFFEKLLRQDSIFYDSDTSLNFASRLNDDLEKIKDSIGEKVGIFGFYLFSALISCVFSFPFGWQLTLAGLSLIPLSVASAILVTKYQSKSVVAEQNAYSEAGKIAEEVFTNIKTVFSYSGQTKEIQRFSKRLEPASKSGTSRAAYTGFGSGFSRFITFALYSVCFTYGYRLVIADFNIPEEDRVYTPGSILTILFNMFIASQLISLCAPYTETFASGVGSAEAVFKLIDGTPTIDSMSQTGSKPSRIRGEIRFDGVNFSYPSRPDVKVLNGISMHIKPGEHVAIVGASGSGKSTILQLIQRFYNLESGSICLDNRNITDLNVPWLRSNIGYVGQEPVLFQGTIKQNVRYGKQDATDSEITSACVASNAHTFIKQLSLGYDTLIGERGATLSGGQKQRVAIARAIVRDPAVMLLDEATSALDSTAERKVQRALDQASVGRTTIVVSHRMSSIKAASRIICIDQGKAVETGTHDQLMQKKGVYFKLVTTDKELLKSVTPSETQVDDTQDAEPVVEETKVKLRRKSARTNSLGKRGSGISLSELRRGSCMSVLSSISGVGVNNNNYVIDSYDDVSKKVDDGVRMLSDWEILKMNGPEWPLLLCGSIAALLHGAAYPAISVLYGVLTGLFILDDPVAIIYWTDYYSTLLAVLALCVSIVMFLQTYMFTIGGIRMTTRLRIETFKSFLKQELSYFETQENTVGALCGRLSSDAASVQGATGMRVGIVLQGITSLFIGIVVAMVFSWKITLVGCVFLPLVIGSIWAEGFVTRKFSMFEKKALEDATNIATESLAAIKTVQNLGIESTLLQRYSVALLAAQEATRQKTKWRGLVYASGIIMPSVCYNVSILYGGTLVVYENLEYGVLLLVVESLLHGAYMLGQAMTFAPSFSASKVAASRIASIIAREPKIQDNCEEMEHKWVAKGEVSLNGVTFAYPGTDELALNNLSMIIKPGQTVALVGKSGCGKSTIVKLLQRFYDTNAGQICLDDRDIRKDLTVSTLRQQYGVVEQEPVLFDRTICKNIAYGDNTRKIKMDEVISAAKLANIHNFIAALPDGYETRVGSRGGQLSGGQKQRICIARAVLRQPRVILLDEATSALDTQSQKSVIEALESAANGRTCITIAHRLSTIEHADVICVIEKGKIVEMGSHEELMNKDGHYRKLQLTEMSFTE